MRVSVGFVAGVDHWPRTGGCRRDPIPHVVCALGQQVFIGVLAARARQRGANHAGAGNQLEGYQERQQRCTQGFEYVHAADEVVFMAAIRVANRVNVVSKQQHLAV